MSAISALRRLLELEAPEWMQARWQRLLYWVMWVTLTGLGGALLAATLNGR